MKRKTGSKAKKSNRNTAYVRMSITVPEKIRSIMDRFPTINWSKTATEAFVRAIEQNRDEVSDFQ